jgi:hypothetical protein
MADRITNSADALDSIAVIERIAELEALKRRTPDDETELAALFELQEQADLDEWQFGVTLIRDNYFLTHTRQEVEKAYGDTAKNRAWPFCCIDWRRAARQLKVPGDYREVTFDGVTYRWCS